MTDEQEMPKRKRRSAEEVRRLVDGFEQSGLRLAEFCRIHGLAQSTLGRQLKRRRLEKGQAAESKRLVAVELTKRDQDGNSQLACALKIALANGRRIEVGPYFDAETLERLVKILERL
jgi:transposase